MFHNLIAGLFGETTYVVLVWLFKLYPLWLPITLGLLFWVIWFKYIRYSFFSTVKTIVLEIKLPTEISKSPAAMEVALMSLYQTSGESNFYNKFYEGKTRTWFSLEIVSEGGQIRFLIWTREANRNLLETQLYSQFPDIEIHQVDDYVTKFNFEPGQNDMWACNYELAQDESLPIMSYIDYGLADNPKEEFKIDPLTTVLEYLSSFKPGENAWFQIVVRAHKKEKHGGFFSKEDSWQDKLVATRKKIYQGMSFEGRSRASDAESKIIDSVERQIQKVPFDVGMRCVYNANKATFNMGTVAGLRGLLRPFGYGGLGKFSVEEDKEKPGKGKTTHFAGFNSFKPSSNTDVDFPWQDFRGIKINRMKEDMLDAYKKRMFFYDPYEDTTNVMTTETLATLWHFPGSVAAAPGLSRIPSKRGQAPTNLPV